MATKHGCPSVIEVSMVWKSASSQGSAALRAGLPSLYAVPARVELISSR